jgi:hypothetical protein
VAIIAGDAAFEEGMMMRQAELPPLVEMTLKTDLRRFAGIDYSVGIAAGLGVDAAGAVATFATDIQGIGPPGHQAGMGRGGKETANLLVARGTLLRADECGPGNSRGHDDLPIHGGAREAQQHERAANATHKEARAPGAQGVKEYLL